MVFLPDAGTFRVSRHPTLSRAHVHPYLTRSNEFSQTGFAMLRTATTQSLSLLLFFVLCQVTGAWCAVPGALGVEHDAMLLDAGMLCPMDGAVMCAPSLTSSPGREIKNRGISDIQQPRMVLIVSALSSDSSVSSRLPWSSVFSLVPISIVSSSVLRI